MHKVAVIGDADSVFGFASIGMRVFPTDDPSQAVTMLRSMVDGGYAVIYITEQLASQIEQELDRYRSRPLPAIVPIPGIKGNTGLGMASVSKSVEKAVGSDILSNS